MIPSVIGTNLTIDDAPLVDGLPMIGGRKRKKSVGKKKRKAVRRVLEGIINSMEIGGV